MGVGSRTFFIHLIFKGRKNIRNVYGLSKTKSALKTSGVRKRASEFKQTAAP